ncbi:hypothetical protein ACI0FR_00880 [Paenochrobactrum sp. BZR 201-1]
MTDALPAETQLLKDLSCVGADQFTSHDYKPGTIKHIVLFRFKTDVTSAQIDQVTAEFKSLQQRCKRDHRPYIQSLTYGEQMNGEGASQGFTLGFIVTFKSEGDRNYYVGEPLVRDPQFYDAAHHKFKKLVSPLLDAQGALVFDFVVS